MITAFIPMHLFAADKADELTILFTHDMHSHFDSDTITKDGLITQKGGFAKVKTIIDDVKSQNPNTIVLDGGDFSMGTLYQTLFSSYAPELKLMELMGYDATTLGNHEFDYRASGLTDMLCSAVQNSDYLVPIVISNIDWQKTLNDNDLKKDAAKLKNAMDAYGVKDYIILEKNGLKIAVFGIIGNEAIDYAPLSGLIFFDPIDRTKELVTQIKTNENPDLIICLSHSGTAEDTSKSEDELLAKAVPDIDIIISGHTHTTLQKPIIYGKTIICSCGSYTYNVGSLTLKKDINGSFSLSEYQLIPVNKEIEDDPIIKNKIEEYKKLVNENYLSQYNYNYDDIVAASTFPFTEFEQFSLKLEEDSLGNLIADSYIYAVKQNEGAGYENIDVAVVPSGVIRDSFDEGLITVSEIYNVSSLGIGKDNIPGYPLVSIYLTGKELKAVAEVDASISTIMPTAQLYMSGLSYTYNPHRLFLNRVTDVYLLQDEQKVTIDDDRLYRVVSGLYSAQMLGTVKEKSFGLLSITPKDSFGNEITDFEDYIIYTQNQTELKEWVALAQYMNSFSEENHIPLVPAYYNQTHNRKITVESKKFTDLIKNPNKVFFIFLAVIIFILLLISFIIMIIRKKLNKQKVLKYKIKAN
jgi:2',3'-cyclic-nucleotide 2'-phosphodiesterase (5'-nucleotidase family)